METVVVVLMILVCFNFMMKQTHQKEDCNLILKKMIQYICITAKNIITIALEH